MTSRLTLNQKAILIAAATRPGGSLLPLPDTVTLRGKALERTLSSLVGRGFAVEAAVNGNAEQDTDEGGSPRGIVIMPAGLTAVGMAAADCAEEAAAPEEPPAVITEDPPAVPGGKLGVMLRAVSSERGATLGDLVDATGWLGHTTRAALTRLRQRGFDIRLDKKDGRRLYRLHRAS